MMSNVPSGGNHPRDLIREILVVTREVRHKSTGNV